MQRKLGSVTTLLLMAFSTGLLLLLHFYEPSPHGLWEQSFLESLHVPVFGVVALSLFAATGLRNEWGVAQRVAVVCAAAIAIAILSEGAQISGPRDASIKDLVSDWLGAAAALLFALALTRRHPFRPTHRLGFAIAGLASCLLALWPLVSVSAAYLERNMRQPVLISFDHHLGQVFRRAQHAALDLRHDLVTDRTAGIITLEEGAWPGLIFNDVWPDWSDYSALVIEFRLEEIAPLEINIRIHDREHELGEQPYSDRFNLSYELQPGGNTLHIPLEKIRNAPRAREMDMSQVTGIVVFCSAGQAGRQFQLFEVWLE